MKPTIHLLALAAVTAFASAQQPVRGVAETHSPAAIQAMAAEIDRLVEQALAQHEQAPLATIDDATFLRRAYLTIVGRIPSKAETEAFLGSRGADKRTALIDQLLDGPGRVSHEANWFADLFRARTRLMRQISGEPFLHWLKESVRQDLPYDQMVTQMLTAEGPALQRGNGQTGYLLRDFNMPHDSMSNSLRVFLGTRLECAQCHDHPFDKWTQMDFYRIAAFQGGMQYRTDFEQSPEGRQLRQTITQVGRDLGRGAQQAGRQMLQQLQAGISGSGTGQDRLPKDYKYENGRPNQAVTAKAIFGPPAELAAAPAPSPAQGPLRSRLQARTGRQPAGREIDSRQAFADWLTSPDNPRFAGVIANRLWARTFGRGLVEPLDDFRDSTEAAIPDLFLHLQGLMLRLDFDLRQFQRVLLHTRVFQRESLGRDLQEGENWFFAGPLLRRMTAEQMWDSLVTLVYDDVDGRLRPTDARANEVYRRYEEVIAMTPEQMKTTLEEAGLRYTDPQKFQALQREKRLAEARTRAAQQQEQNQAAQPLLRALLQARRRGDQAEVARIQAKLRELGVTVPGERRIGAAGGGELTRASDQPQPAPLGSLLRQFGQSDRETIEGGSTAASVPQVLTLMNGFLDERIWPVAQTALRRALDEAKTADGKLDAAFLTLLNRKPTRAELAEWRPIVQKEPQGLQDLVWVLFNSHEFRFVR